MKAIETVMLPPKEIFWRFTVEMSDAERKKILKVLESPAPFSGLGSIRKQLQEILMEGQ